jgi:hypothetical protein
MARACREARGEVYHATLTLPHKLEHRLKPLVRTVAKCFSKVISGAGWVRWRDAHCLGFIRALEVKVGPNGWHPHLHVLFFATRPFTEEDLEQFRQFLYRRWCQVVVAAKYGAPSPEYGVTLDISYRDDYLAKLGLEMTGDAFKAGRPGRRTPWEVLADYAAHHREADRRLWREYCEAMRGARQLTYSLGFRKRWLPDEEEKADRAVVEAEAEGPAQGAHTFDAEVWDMVVAPDPSLRARLLDAAEEYGERGVRAVLVEYALRTPYPGVPF